MSKPIVLIADDHESLRRSLRDWLLSEHPHCEILEANCAEEALRIAGKNTLALVVMDIGFSGMSGIEATRRLLKQDPGLPVVILSVYDEDSYRADAEAAGAVAYIAKRRMQQEFMTAVSRFIPQERGES